MTDHYWHATMSFPDGRVGSICVAAPSYSDAEIKLKMLFPDGYFVGPKNDPADKGPNRAESEEVRKTASACVL